MIGAPGKDQTDGNYRYHYNDLQLEQSRSFLVVAWINFVYHWPLIVDNVRCIVYANNTTTEEYTMELITILLAAVGGLCAGTGLATGDVSLILLGITIAAIGILIPVAFVLV